MGRVERIADAVRHEGHVLWPDREMRRECVAVATPDTALCVRVRFLQVAQCAVARLTENGREPVDELTVGDAQYVACEEPIEREILVPQLRFGGRSREQTRIDIPAGEEREVLHDSSAQPVGLMTRSWRTLSGSVEVETKPLGADRFRVTVRIVNQSQCDSTERERALRSSFCSTDTILRIEGGELVSLTAPAPQPRERITS